MSRILTDGDPSSRIWIVGEAPGRNEVEQGRPFVGASGIELDKMLREAGLLRAQCFLTNVCHERPPSIMKNGKVINDNIEQWFLGVTAARATNTPLISGRFPAEPIRDGVSILRDLLLRHKPTLVIALGNTALWALSSHTGITKWRGSVFDTSEARDAGPAATGGKVIATFHPADVLRQWTHRPIVVQDLRRAVRESTSPNVHKTTWNFTIPRTVADVRAWLGDYGAFAGGKQLIADTEGWGRVDCIGFAASAEEAICIPFVHETNIAADLSNLHYWTEEDEFDILQFLRQVLTTNDITFHNALWDTQVILRSWGFLPRLGDDTQVMQHVAFPGLIGGKIDPVTGEVAKTGSSLSLSFIASMYCSYYRYWKDDGRHFDPSIGDEIDYWRYNCEDCVRTYECRDSLRATLERYNLQAQYEMKMREFGPVLAMMLRGLPYDVERAKRYRAEVDKTKHGVREWLSHVTETDFNPWSAPQCKALFYDDLCLPKMLNRHTKAPTLDDAALETIGRKNPILRPLVQQIQNFRTLDTVKDDMDPALPGPDGIVRFALNVAFVETMRFSCNSTAHGEGGNMQNIKRPDDE